MPAPPLSPEFRFVVGCCRWPRTAEIAADLRAIARDVASWPSIMRLAERHRVIGLVRVACVDVGIALPREVARALALAALRIDRQNRQAAAETVRLQRLFDDAGIPALFFKGAVLAQQVYGRLDIKHSKDIDVLIPPESARTVAALLEPGGYRLWLPLPQLSPAQWRQVVRLRKETAMVAPATGLQVEPHWRLNDDPRILPHLDARSPGVSVDLPGLGAVRTLGTDDLFAYLCVHGTQHGWIRLKWLAELDAMIAPLPPAEIERLFHHAVAVSGALWPSVALTLCATVFGRALPPTVAATIGQEPHAARVAALSMAALLGDGETLPWYKAMSLQLALGWARGDLARQVWHQLIGGVESLTHPLPPALDFLYVPARLPLAVWRKSTGRRSVGAIPE